MLGNVFFVFVGETDAPTTRLRWQLRLLYLISEDETNLFLPVLALIRGGADA